MLSTRHTHRRAGAPALALVLITVLLLTGCDEHSTTGPVASGPPEGEFSGPAVEGIILDSHLLPGGGYFVRTYAPNGGSQLIWGEDDGSVNQSIHLDTPVTGAVTLADGSVIISQGTATEGGASITAEGPRLVRLTQDGRLQWEVAQRGRVVPGSEGTVLVLDVRMSQKNEYGWYSLTTTYAPYTLDGDTLPRWQELGDPQLRNVTSLATEAVGICWYDLGWNGMPSIRFPHILSVRPESRTLSKHSGHRGVYPASLSGFSMAPDGTHGFCAGVEYAIYDPDSVVVLTRLNADLSWDTEVRVPMYLQDIELADVLALRDGGALLLCLGPVHDGAHGGGGAQLLLAGVSRTMQPQWVREVRGAEYGVFYLGGDLRENPDGGISVLAFRDDGSAVRPLLLHLGPDGI